MKRKRKQKRRQLRMIHLWSYPQAQKAMPYLRSITQSLREHWLDLQTKRLAVDRLSHQPGRQDRSAILASAGQPRKRPRRKIDSPTPSMN